MTNTFICPFKSITDKILRSKIRLLYLYENKAAMDNINLKYIILKLRAEESLGLLQ